MLSPTLTSIHLLPTNSNSTPADDPDPTPKANDKRNDIPNPTSDDRFEAMVKDSTRGWMDRMNALAELFEKLCNQYIGMSEAMRGWARELEEEKALRGQEEEALSKGQEDVKTTQ